MNVRKMGKKFLADRLLPVLEQVARQSYLQGVEDAKNDEADVEEFWQASEENCRKVLNDDL